MTLVDMTELYNLTFQIEDFKMANVKLQSAGINREALCRALTHQRRDWQQMRNLAVNTERAGKRPLVTPAVALEKLSAIEEELRDLHRVDCLNDMISIRDAAALAFELWRHGSRGKDGPLDVPSVHFEMSGIIQGVIVLLQNKLAFAGCSMAEVERQLEYHLSCEIDAFEATLDI